MIPIKDNIPTDRFPLVTVALILVNVLAYMFACGHGGSLISGPDLTTVVKYGAIPYELTHSGQHCVVAAAGTISCGQNPAQLATWETVFTSMFVHGSIVQLAGNMMFLWIFGGTVEDSMGAPVFLCFYVLGGVAALVVQVLLDPGLTAPTIGAAGAIAAVLGGYVVLYRRGRVLAVTLIPLFSTVVELPVMLMLVAWVVMQAVFAAVGLITPTASGGIAYLAYAGGLALGLLTIRLIATRRKPTPPTAAAFR